jgi:hypothetical protein
MGLREDRLQKKTSAVWVGKRGSDGKERRPKERGREAVVDYARANIYSPIMTEESFRVHKELRKFCAGSKKTSRD